MNYDLLKTRLKLKKILNEELKTDVAFFAEHAHKVELSPEHQGREYTPVELNLDILESVNIVRECKFLNLAVVVLRAYFEIGHAQKKSYFC